MNPTELTSWQRLTEHAEIVGETSMRRLFELDPDRFHTFSLQAGDLLIDYSKNRVTQETMDLLLSLAEEADVAGWRQQMFSGNPINHTEHRSVLHVALRNYRLRPMFHAGKDVMPDVQRVLQRMKAFSDAVLSGSWTGATGKRITDVVNIGIGGSDLGPLMVVEALRPFWRGPVTPHFVSNVDGAHVTDTLANLRPETTLFLVASKTFTTQETMANAFHARQWVLDALTDKGAISRHFAAMSTNAEAVREFGIEETNRFDFWDWVGGRYSLWSAIGLSIACTVGFSAFAELLDGAREMDLHFESAPFHRNAPVLLALLGIWNSNFLGAETHCVVPYEQHLHRFPAYLQQGDMESNGKRIDREGAVISDYSTGPILWGEPGTNGQHAFFQLIHQGTRLIPLDFLLAKRPLHNLTDQHDMLLANCLAQSRALMWGKTEAEARIELEAAGLSPKEVQDLLPYKVFQGNSPSNTILYPSLTPRVLGQLIALYEHRIFVQGIIWNINSFDQWGVELGKQLASGILSVLKGETGPRGLDSSTSGLLSQLLEEKKASVPGGRG